MKTYENMCSSRYMLKSSSHQWGAMKACFVSKNSGMDNEMLRTVGYLDGILGILGNCEMSHVWPVGFGAESSGGEQHLGRQGHQGDLVTRQHPYMATATSQRHQQQLQNITYRILIRFIRKLGD